MEQTFESMQMDRSLVEALKLAEITVPTEIQQKVIPEAQKNHDLIFQSETGTGKTLAYLLPLFGKIDTEKKEMQALILVPTHELAIQVIRVIELLSLNSELKVTSTPIIGDVNITRQVDKLRTKPHIIVGTAGRILELIQKKKISAHTIRNIIVDEADRLLDDSNIEGIKAVIKTTLKERHIMMCSASMSARTIERAKLLMKEPQIIKSKTAIEVPDTIDHIYFVAEQRDKIEVLRKLVRIMNPPKAIAFFANAEDIAEATEKLQFHKLRADGLHGSNIKSDRKKTMEDFKSGRLQLLIASDIAARGLDIEGVSHIINVNMPERSMEYLHRAGRTGRNGNEGLAVSIVTEKEIPLIKQYERELRISIIPKSMYNGAIVEYRKEKKKFDTTSEYGQRPDKRKGVTEAGNGEVSGTTKSRYKKADRDDRKYKHPGKDKLEPGHKKGDSPESRFDKDDKKPSFRGTKIKIGGKPDNKFDRGERTGSKFKREDGKPGSKFGRDERPGSKFKREDGRPGSKFKREDGRPGSKFKREDGKPGSKFGRDERPGSKFKREDGKPGSKFGRDERPGSKFKREDGKPGSKFGRDERPGSKFKREDGKPGSKFGRDERPGSKFKREDDKPGSRFEKDGNKPFSKQGREEKGEKRFGKDSKQNKTKFVGKPPKNLKPWERKPQQGKKGGNK